MLWLFILGCLGLTSADQYNQYSTGSYFITSANEMQRGMPFNMTVDILNTTIPVHVRAEIERVWNNYTHYYRIPIAMDQDDFVKGTTGKLSLKIPRTLESGRYELHVRGSNGLTFHRSMSLPLKYNSISIFVQTDKAMYKPGQVVHFRAFGIYPNLQVYTGKFEVTLTDPNSNTLKVWTGLFDPTGVVEGSFMLADQPVLGDWKLKIEAEDQIDTKTKSFTVAQYQLPRFEVKVELPPFALIGDHALHGTVKTKYTFGKPVKGQTVVWISNSQATDYCGNPPQHIELSFPTDGDTKFEVPLKDIRTLTYNLNHHTIYVTAFVKEDLTGMRLNGSSSIKFYTHPYKIEFLDSSPKTFSPKLPYTAYVKISDQDNIPLNNNNDMISIYTCVNYHIVQGDQYMYSCSDFSGRYSLPGQNYTIPPSGIVAAHMRIPENTTSIEVKVHYKDITDTLTVRMKNSLSQNFIQIKLQDNHPLRSMETAHFTVERTEENVTAISYEVLSRGTVAITNQIQLGKSKTASFSVPVYPTMSPEARIIAYYVRPSGEVIADSLTFSVDDAFDNHVTIDFSRNESKPHDNIDVLLTADPQSSVNLLAVDQSVLLLKSGNDITQGQVLDELKGYSSGSTDGDFSEEVFSISSSSRKAADIFSDAGLNVMTDVLYYNHYYTDHTYTGIAYTTPYFGGPYPGATPYLGPTPWPIGYTPFAGVTPYQGPKLPGTGGQKLKEVKRVRTEFPETWLWVNKTVGADGKASINTTVPDTITSWIASAFAVNPTSGLGVAGSTTKLRVFRPFFVSLNMPSSVLRGEQVVVQANIFNYLSTDVDVVVSLPSSSAYVNLVVDSKGATTQESKDQTHNVKVKSNKQASVYFPIMPASLGAIDIEVSARSTLAADAVRRPLYVQAEGLPKEFNTPVFVELTPGGGDFHQKIPMTLPPQAVTGSEKCRIKVTGDLIGASLDSLESLIALPTGCGEQNMMTFAPDVYIADYLTTTRQMTPAIESRISSYLDLGFQRELTYQRHDGSYSAFGERDEAGSMWLTAFVARTFHQARPYTFVGNSTLTRALNWMANRQNLDGSFNEPGLTLDHRMQKSRISLTASVLLAFLENSDMAGYGITEWTYGNATQNATHYLEVNAASISDPYTLAITSYALSLAASKTADVVYNQLNAQAHVKGDMKYWIEPKKYTTNYYTRWSPSHIRADPIDIQTTAYGLLATSSRGDVKQGLAITKWLMAQRNPYGGFSSTHDTMLALQALTDFARHTHTPGFDVEIDIKAGSENMHVSVTDKNALDLQTKATKAFPSEVEITGTGKGVAYVEVDAFFNVEAEIGEPAFEVNTVLLDDTLKNFRLMTCTKWLKQGTSGMTVMEISIPSGFEPDVSTIGHVIGLKRVERKGRNINVYFDQIGQTSTCFDFLSTRNGMVVHNQDAYVTVYDYYQPTDQASVFYHPRGTRDATICDVCDKCCPQP